MGMRLKVKQLLIRNPVEYGETYQFAAHIFDGKRKIHSSTGYPYAADARRAGIAWIESRQAHAAADEN